MLDNNLRTLSYDVAFDLLRNTRRRFVLRQLQDAPDGIELSELSSALAAMENDVPADELSREDRKRIYVSLYQTHIPKLEDSGVVRYDAEAGVVHPTERVSELASYFDDDTRLDSGMPMYLIVAVAGLALYWVVNAIALPVVDSIDVGVGILIAIAILSLVQYVYTGWIVTDGPRIPVNGE